MKIKVVKKGSFNVKPAMCCPLMVDCGGTAEKRDK